MALINSLSIVARRGMSGLGTRLARRGKSPLMNVIEKTLVYGVNSLLTCNRKKGFHFCLYGPPPFRMSQRK